MYICDGQIRIWIIYIYMVRFEFEFFFFAGKSTVEAVLDWTALTNTHSRGGRWYSRPYRSPLQGRLILPATLTEVTVGTAKNTSRPYRGHCRGGQETGHTEAPSVGTPWEGRLAQLPLQLTSVVVRRVRGFVNQISYFIVVLYCPAGYDGCQYI